MAGLPVAIGYNVARSKTPEDPRNIDDVFRSIRTSDVLTLSLPGLQKTGHPQLPAFFPISAPLQKFTEDSALGICKH